MYKKHVYNFISKLLLPNSIKDNAAYIGQQAKLERKIEQDIDKWRNSDFAFAYISSYEGI